MVPDWLSSCWDWMRRNDLPNWIGVTFSLIVWPLVLASLAYWINRKISRVPGLEVALHKGRVIIGGADKTDKVEHSAVDFYFRNKTGAIVYLSHVRIRNCSNLFPVAVDATRDISDSSYELKFFNPSTIHYDFREKVLHTNDEVRSTMAVSTHLSADFFSYRVPFYRRWLRLRKYFVLEFVALVGTRKYFVSMMY